MKKVSISVTEAARNLAECINRARYQNTSFVLLKNGLPVAELVPAAGDKACTGRDLTEALAEVELPVAEANAWRRDLARARKILKAPVSKWQ